MRYNASVREYELFLRLLADRVLTARLSTGARVLDAGDFKAWLIECSEVAAACETVEQFFGKLR
jgi:hypothetical protein